MRKAPKNPQQYHGENERAKKQMPENQAIWPRVLMHFRHGPGNREFNNQKCQNRPMKKSGNRVVMLLDRQCHAGMIVHDVTTSGFGFPPGKSINPHGVDQWKFRFINSAMHLQIGYKIGTQATDPG